jgi:hypothetical protein
MIKTIGKEELKARFHNEKNICEECGEKLISHINARRERDRYGNRTGRWLCEMCGCRNRQLLFDSQNNVRKQLRDTRTGNLDPNSKRGKGNLAEELTCRWRSIISIIPVENLNIKFDNYNTPIDHSYDSELGIIQTKSAIYNSDYGLWGYNWEGEFRKDFDNIILYCKSKNGKHIERTYIFPKDEVLKRRKVSIVKKPSRGVQWYEVYRVDEDTVKLIDKIFQEILGETK